MNQDDYTKAWYSHYSKPLSAGLCVLGGGATVIAALYRAKTKYLSLALEKLRVKG